MVESRWVPLAVIAIAGTTEEGAVDPIHLIAQMRGPGRNFWLHIDAAWGGYLRTLFTPACDIEDVRAFVSRDGIAWGERDVCEAAAEAGKQSHLDEFFERLDENTLAVLRELRQPTQLRETADSKQSPSPVDR